MGILSFLGDAKSTLFGDDSETTNSSGPTSGTKNTVDSGQTTNGTATQNSHTNQFNSTLGQTLNSGSTNTSTSSGRTDTSKQAGYADTQTIGGSTSSTTTGGRVDTSQVMLSETAVNHLINGMLSSNQGLAAVSSGKNAAGGYNSTAQSLLTNDLLSRVAGEVAVRGAKTVNTTGSQTSTTVNSGSANVLRYGEKNASQTVGSSVVTDIIGGSSSINVGNTTGSSNTSQAGTQNQVSGPRTVNETANTSGSTSKSEKDDKGVLDWIICTELHNQNRMPYRNYIYGARKFMTYDDRIKKGYYIWAVPATKHLRKHPDSLFSKFLEVIFNARASYYAGNTSVVNTCVSGLIHGFCWGLSRTIAVNYNYNRSDIYPKGV